MSNQFKHFRPTRVISGGQTGADRGGMAAALRVGIPIAGWGSRGLWSESGRVPEPYRAAMREAPGGYQLRTRLNVEEADVTLIFTRGDRRNSPGSRLTAWMVRNEAKPYLWVDPWDEFAQEGVAAFLDDTKPTTLNVAGNRESVAPGIEAATRDLLVRVWEVVG